MHDGSDDRAPGAAITAALCGHWDHEDPCRWPHRTDTSRRGELLNVRTYFDAPPEEETEVRHLIQSALGSGKLIGQDGSVISWEVVSSEHQQSDKGGTAMGEAAAVAERIRKSFEDKDWSSLRSLYHEDAVQEWPQSGERFVGRDNIVAAAENYPALPEMKGFRVVAETDSLAVTELLLDYGGGLHFGIGITEIESGLVRKRTEYFNEPFEAAEWRSKWAERM